MRKLFLFAIAMLAFPSRGHASEPLFDSAPLDDEELAQARGGYSLPGGIQVDFGAVITTSLDGQRLLQTELQFTDNTVISHVVGGNGVPVEIGGAAANDGGQGAGNITVVPGNTSTPAYLTASVQLTDLLIRHSVGNQISSVVANTGDGRVIDSQVSINLRLDNVDPMTLGSLGFRIEAMSLDAASFRGP